MNIPRIGNTSTINSNSDPLNNGRFGIEVSVSTHPLTRMSFFTSSWPTAQSKCVLPRWEPTKVRVAALNDILDTQQVDLQTRINWDAIEVAREDQKMSAKLFVDNAEALLSKPGRWTIRGANGSGKSSLTLFLKLRLGDAAFYLQPHSHLMFVI
jgi:hypothetical protein